jgi:hypothetical protein
MLRNKMNKRKLIMPAVTVILSAFSVTCSAQNYRVVYEARYPLTFSKPDSVEVIRNGKEVPKSSFDAVPAITELKIPLQTVTDDSGSETTEIPSNNESSITMKVNTPDRVFLKDGKWFTQKDNKISVPFKQVAFEKTAESKTILGYKCRKILFRSEDHKNEGYVWAASMLPATITPITGFPVIEGAILDYHDSVSGGSISAVSIDRFSAVQ